MNNNRQFSLIQFTAFAFLWGVAALGVLSMKDIRGSWDYAVCGVWGCTPPLAAVAACQAIWGLVLFPIAWWVNRSYSPRVQRLTALTSLGVSQGALLVIVVYEYFHWFLFVAEENRIYFGRRLALSTLTQVDFPVVMLFLASLMLLAFSWKSSKRSEQEKLTEPQGDDHAAEPSPEH